MAAYSAGEGGVGVFAYTRVRLFDNSMSRVGAYSRKRLIDAVPLFPLPMKSIEH